MRSPVQSQFPLPATPRSLRQRSRRDTEQPGQQSFQFQRFNCLQTPQSALALLVPVSRKPSYHWLRDMINELGKLLFNPFRNT